MQVARIGRSCIGCSFQLPTVHASSFLLHARSSLVSSVSKPSFSVRFSLNKKLRNKSKGISQALNHADVYPIYELSEGLETPVQLIYLTTLLGFLAVGVYLVVRQVLIRRELDEAAKGLGERIRTGEATCEDYFELGVILTRKRLYTQATKNLEKAKKTWDGEESELAQVHNALGFCYFNMEKVDSAIEEYKKAVNLQPGYVTAWNNLGDAYERLKKWREALQAYQEALTYAPSNRVAMQRSDFCKSRVEQLRL